MYGGVVATQGRDWQIPAITDDIVDRYKSNYSLAIPVTRQMVREHAELELDLTQKLLNSDTAERSKIWSDSYSTLYRKLPWLASTTSSQHDSEDGYRYVLKLIPVGANVIEIGSGAGALAEYLTHNGRPCIATEVTSERGHREDGVLVWHQTDGVNLDQFEAPASYDAIVSMQVVEHFHPDDLDRHFKSAHALLKPGGQYFVTTPHAFLGPADLSRVFSLDRPRFMHLKEYTYRELGAIARDAGFRNVAAVYVPPRKIRRMFPFTIRSRLLFHYLSAMDAILRHVRLPRLMLYGLFYTGDVSLIVRK
jgi:SAM-dependent methyltransferase